MMNHYQHDHVMGAVGAGSEMGTRAGNSVIGTREGNSAAFSTGSLVGSPTDGASEAVAVGASDPSVTERVTMINRSPAAKVFVHCSPGETQQRWFLSQKPMQMSSLASAFTD